MIENIDGVKLYMKKGKVEHPRAVVVIVHGMSEHLGRYDYMTSKLEEQGFLVYRYDQRGHGLSEGQRGYCKNYRLLVEDLNLVAEMAKQENPEIPFYLMGHSMGGMVVALYSSIYSKLIDGVILFSALTRGNQPCALPESHLNLPGDTPLLNQMAGGTTVNQKVIREHQADKLGLKQISVGLFNSCIDGVHWLKTHPEMFTLPVLILHGDCDAIVNKKDSIEFFQEVGSCDKTLKIYASLLHELLNEPIGDSIIDETLFWLEYRVNGTQIHENSRKKGEYGYVSVK